MRKRGPPEGGTPNLRRSEFRIYAVLHPRLVPVFSVVAQRILVPDALRLFSARLRQVLRCAAPWPIGPARRVTVAHGIVMHVIQCRPVMSVRPHSAFDSTEENFSPARLLLAVPSMRCPSMQQSQVAQQGFYVRRFHQRVIMIRQHAPSKRLAHVCREHSQQVARKNIHALRAVTDVMTVLK